MEFSHYGFYLLGLVVVSSRERKKPGNKNLQKYGLKASNSIALHLSMIFETAEKSVGYPIRS